MANTEKGRETTLAGLLPLVDRAESVPELRELAARVESRIAELRAQKKQELAAEFRRQADLLGMTPEEVLREGAAPRYRHPERPGLTWVGRGRRPRWLVEALAAGATLKELEITR